LDITANDNCGDFRYTFAKGIAAVQDNEDETNAIEQLPTSVRAIAWLQFVGAAVLVVGGLVMIPLGRAGVLAGAIMFALGGIQAVLARGLLQAKQWARSLTLFIASVSVPLAFSNEVSRGVVSSAWAVVYWVLLSRPSARGFFARGVGVLSEGQWLPPLPAQGRSEAERMGSKQFDTGSLEGKPLSDFVAFAAIFCFVVLAAYLASVWAPGG